MVYTPTNASWLNWIECEFTAIRYFTLDGSDYPSHRRPGSRHRWLHPLAQPPLPPETPLAVNSKIRRPDYLPNVA